MPRPNPILALVLIALLAVPAVAGNGNGNSNGAGNGNSNGAGNSNGNGNASPGGGSGKADKTVTKVLKDEKVARDAVKKNEVLSLTAITSLVAKTSGGRILDVQMVRFDGTYVYEVTVLEADGRLHKLYYNAQSGAVMEPL